MPTTQITDAQIEALRAEAGTAGDLEQVAICDRALNGDVLARAGCRGCGSGHHFPAAPKSGTGHTSGGDQCSTAPRDGAERQGP